MNFLARLPRYEVIWAPTFSERRSLDILSICEKPTISTSSISFCKIRMSCLSFYEREPRSYVTIKKVQVKVNFNHLLCSRSTTLGSTFSASSLSISQDNAKPNPKIAKDTNAVDDRHANGQGDELNTS